MKQSFYLITIQLIAIVVGAVSTFYVAYKLPASLYALIGVQAIITSILVVFSNTGLETLGLRNFLLWKNKNKITNIKIITTQSVVLRLCLSIFISILLYFYASYISANKFNGNNLPFLLLFIVSGVFMALNDTFRLLLKAHNKFLQAVISSYFVSIFGKTFALFIFISYGLSWYLYTLISLPIIIFFYLFFISKSHIKLRYAYSTKLLLNSLKQSKHFAFSSYFSYLFNNIDQFLISILMPPEILGVFSLVKRVFDMLKGFIANFFDPLLQKSVAYKGNYDAVKPHLKKVTNWRNIVFLISIIGSIIFYFKGQELILRFGFKEYPYLSNYLFYAFTAISILLLFKTQFYLIAAFTKSIVYLRFTIIVSIISILSFVFFVFVFDTQYIFSYLILANVAILVFSNYTLKKEGGLKSIINQTHL